jgi:6-phosphofructokinase
MKRIGLVTSGGDAPGMNATIRAVTRVAHSEALEVLGFEHGWDGLITNRFRMLVVFFMLVVRFCAHRGVQSSGSLKVYERLLRTLLRIVLMGLLWLGVTALCVEHWS